MESVHPQMNDHELASQAKGLIVVCYRFLLKKDDYIRVRTGFPGGVRGSPLTTGFGGVLGGNPFWKSESLSSRDWE